jgi:hypothetical protein
MKFPTFSKKTHPFIKPANELGIAVAPPWKLFLAIFFILFVTACALSYEMFSYATAERAGVYVPQASVNPSVDAAKSDAVLEFFGSREINMQSSIQNPGVFADPSR